jgi:hypothetical protein
MRRPNLSRLPCSPRRLPVLLVAAMLALTGCQSVYYGALEKIGVPKREVLVDRVSKARNAQEEAKEQFASALEKFLAITRVEPGELKARYDLLNAELKSNESRAKEVRDRIDGVKSVAGALFDEWTRELEQYSSADLRARSASQLELTRKGYGDLIAAMERAAVRMDPVLTAFRDQVLFLKHNLNAQAIRSLDTTSKTLQADIGRLIQEMERSIREADAFLKTIQPVT